MNKKLPPSRVAAQSSPSLETGHTELSVEELLHELQVHQVELEMQNEELRSAYLSLEKAKDEYVTLYEFAPVGYVTLNRDAVIKKTNLAAAAMLGFDRSKLIDRRFSMFVAPQDRDRWHRLFLQITQSADVKQQAVELKMLSTQGSDYYVNLECLRWKYVDGSPEFRIRLSDISKLKHDEADLRIAAAAFESQEGIMVTDANGEILRVNRAFTDITGYSAEEVIGKNPRILQSGRQNAEFYAAMWESLLSTGKWEGEIWNRRKCGEVYPEHLTITAVKGVDGIVSNYVATLTDITLSKAVAEEIQNLAFYDSLTGLPNRRLLLDRLNKALASSARSGREGALLFIDLDNFKNLNDTLGHDIGDLLLRQVAERLTASVRDGDTVARMGGDEYVVMLDNLSEQTSESAAQAEAIGNKILAILNQPYQLAAHEYCGGGSIGVAIFGDHEQSLEELLKHADIAMYQAKKAGRNALRFFDPQMQETINARASLEDELRKAFTKQEFQLHYQIQVDADQHPLGAEALIRWKHQGHGMVSPVEFIPLMEETNMFMPVGQWVLEQACAQLKAWGRVALTRGLVLSVNVGARQFHSADFVGQVQAAVQHHAIDPMLFKLELTESLLLENIENTVKKLGELKEIGIQISLDDFGTGYSSLQDLKRLPLDQLKIDKSFVGDICVNTNARAITRTIIAMAHSLSLNVIAEGVETKEQLQLLLKLSCTNFQGYLFGKPLPVAKFERSLGQKTG